MLYLDNRLYLNVKCVLGAHFYHAVFFLCKKSLCKIAQGSISAPGPSFLEQLFLYIKCHYHGMKEVWDSFTLKYKP